LILWTTALIHTTSFRFEARRIFRAGCDAIDVRYTLKMALNVSR